MALNKYKSMEITKKLKYITFIWDGKNMEILYPNAEESLKINRVYLLSLIRFGLRALTRRRK